MPHHHSCVSIQRLDSSLVVTFAWFVLVSVPLFHYSFRAGYVNIVNKSSFTVESAFRLTLISRQVCTYMYMYM